MTRLERDQIRMAIVHIHFNAEYHRGMKRLCKMVGWEGLTCPNPFDSEAEQSKVRRKFNAWVASERLNP